VPDRPARTQLEALFQRQRAIPSAAQDAGGGGDTASLKSEPRIRLSTRMAGRVLWARTIDSEMVAGWTRGDIRKSAHAASNWVGLQGVQAVSCAASQMAIVLGLRLSRLL